MSRLNLRTSRSPIVRTTESLLAALVTLPYKVPQMIVFLSEAFW
jgi:hypothetical protein